MNIQRYEEPQPWMLGALVNNAPLGSFINPNVILRTSLSHHDHRERFWLGDEAAGWWCPIVIDTDMDPFERMIAGGPEAPRLAEMPTLPVVNIPQSYELTYSYLLRYHMNHPEGAIPWAQWGLEAVEQGWGTLAVPNPIETLRARTLPKGAKYEAGSFEHWLRVTRKDLVVQCFGSRAEHVDYRIVTDVNEVARAINLLLPTFIAKWWSYFEQHYDDAFDRLPEAVFEQAKAARRFFSSRHHMEESHYYDVWLYFSEELSWALRNGTGYVVIGYHDEKPVVMVTARVTPGPNGCEAHTELVMKTDADFRRYALVPTAHAHALRAAFWQRGLVAVDLQSNWDPSIDGYKVRFGAVERPIPGLRFR